MANIIKASLDLFIAISVIYALFQDISGLRSTDSAAPLDTPTNSTPIEQLPEIAGVTIKVTDNLRKPLTDLLTKEQYNVKVESYTFEGQDWWKETIISYGHIILVYVLMGKYKA